MKTASVRPATSTPGMLQGAAAAVAAGVATHALDHAADISGVAIVILAFLAGAAVYAVAGLLVACMGRS